MSQPFEEEKENNLENWKQFRGTELGSLLGQIYGNENKPTIKYPKLKTRQDQVSQPLENSVFSFSKDEKKKRMVKPVVQVPKLSGAKCMGSSNAHSVDDVASVSAISYVPHRRQEKYVHTTIYIVCL